jgi:ornithine cyclodeaminase/alanine dehydrogenase-like protein (mu-crystallin family)
MVRYLTEQDVRQLLSMRDVVTLVEAAFRARAEGLAFDTPRVRTRTPQGTLHVLQAAAPALNRTGFKAYYTSAAGIPSHVNLYDSAKASLDAIIESGHLGMMRTGGASAVATRTLSRADAAVVAMIGAGEQAIGQLEGVCAVRTVRDVRVYSRTDDRAREFCDRMSSRLGIAMRSVASVAEAVRGADIVNVITTSATPVLLGEWLEPGQHVNAAGSNSLIRRELDEAAIARCDVIAVDSRGTARKECGDLLPAVQNGLLAWEGLAEIGEVLLGRRAGRSSREQITLFESHGMGIQDLYVADALLAMARARGVGIELAIGQ